MNLLVPVDVWQEETNAHLAQDLGRMLPLGPGSCSGLCTAKPTAYRKGCCR